MAPPNLHTPVVQDWLQECQRHSQSTRQDDPNYWISNPETLITTSQPVDFTLGTGEQVLSRITAACLDAQSELVITTCFWARSLSQEAIASLLRKLSSKALAQNRIITVRICFSSLSLWQKLFQTSSPAGKIYSSEEWVNLGLPGKEELAGLDLIVKSVFVRPFSVMHPKFIIVDRRLAWVGSCNVSWESWFEGGIQLEGDFVARLLDFWNNFWGRENFGLPSSLNNLSPEAVDGIGASEASNTSDDSIKRVTFDRAKSPIPTILLPSPHHINPRFSIPFIARSPSPPITPLNCLLLSLFTHAKTSIYIQTPNLTSEPVITSLFTALERGIDVTVVTSTVMMLAEQLVTAGTITEFEIWKLRRRYANLLSTYTASLGRGAGEDPEAQMLALKPGQLRIAYYTPLKGGFVGAEEPVKSHIKVTIVDDEITVLGSGNMDRASWFTSQELGVAFMDKEITQNVRTSIEEGLEGRLRWL